MANYGGISAVIGHETIHGFDDEGRRCDGAGVLSTWWARSDACQFNARAAVLRRQFDAYEPFPGIHVKGDLTTAGDPLALKMLMARSSSIARRLND